MLLLSERCDERGMTTSEKKMVPDRRRASIRELKPKGPLLSTLRALAVTNGDEVDLTNALVRIHDEASPL